MIDKMPVALSTAWDLILATLKREPDRDFSTMEIAKASGVPAYTLVVLGPLCEPYARRGAERMGFGKQAGKMVRPFVWAYPSKDASNDCT